MKAVVVDADVVKAFFEEDVLGIAPDVTGSPRDAFNSFGACWRAYLDEGGQIENEWRQLVDREWFEGWFARALADGALETLRPPNCRTLLRRLRDLGFPVRTRDKWYVRVAMALVRDRGESIILTEDCDFFEPAAKGRTSGYRRRLMESGSGGVCRHLAGESVLVTALCRFECSEAA